MHSCLLLTKWDVDTLTIALTDDPSPLFFVLTNTRGMSPNEAAIITREVCRNLKAAIFSLNNNNNNNDDDDDDDEASNNKTTPGRSRTIHPILVSRSDSTLRGHYPVETNVMAEELGPFDAHFLIPAFFEGGRITRNGTHYLQQPQQQQLDQPPLPPLLIPCHDTEFAKDSVFGYSTSYLPDYIAEKTQGTIPADHVEQFTLDDLRHHDGAECYAKLRALHNNTCCIVDCEVQADLDRFATQLIAVVANTNHNNNSNDSSNDNGNGNGNATSTEISNNDDWCHRPRTFLFRSGASILTSLAMLPPQPIQPTEMGRYVKDSRPGVILIGSHVKKTTLQLEQLLKMEENTVVRLLVNVERIYQHKKEENTEEQLKALLLNILSKIRKIHTEGKTPVIYTSRTELTDFDTDEERLLFGQEVSKFLMEVVQNLPTTIGFLISKGGITTNDVLSHGLSLPTSRVLGQILPGCSVVKCPSDHPRYPDLPVVIFPVSVYR